MIKCNKAILRVIYKILNSSKKIINIQLLIFGLLILFGSTHANTIKDTPVFDLSFEDLETGEKEHFYKNPVRVVSQGNVEITHSSTEAQMMMKMGVESQNGAKSLVYANGMRTNWTTAAGNLKKIKNRLQYVIGTSDFRLAFNQSEDLHKELAEVATQHLMQQNNSTERQAWKLFAFRLLQPNKYNILDTLEGLISIFDEDNYVNDTDLQKHINIYLPLLEDKKKVVILAHSQGNFYANRSWNAIKQLPNGDNLSKQIGIVAVATPAFYVADGGLHTTNTLDTIIGGVALTSIPPKVANETHPFSLEDPFGHGITEIYLDTGIDGTRIRTKIEGDINTTFNRLIVYDPSCQGLSKTGSGHTEISGYTPGVNFSGYLNYKFNSFTLKNTFSIYSQFHSPMVLTGYFPNILEGNFYYNWAEHKALEIIIDSDYDPSSTDKWELDITCPLY